MLRAPDGRPRLSVLSIAHLADEERLFVTALLLDKVKTWMRRQPGTTGLRALVYMDEVFGYLPPHPANPPTKRPLLTLLKQARAQGVGVLLATQNPVDLDYKGLANMGTWMVGTLQTQQDRDRLSAGLQGAGLEPAAVARLLAGTKKRVFLLHDVHRKGPVLLHSRFAMSYLRGPLTRDEIARLAKERPEAPAIQAPGAAPAGLPVLPPPFRHLYLKRRGGEVATPHLLVKYAVRYKGAGEEVGVRAWPLEGATPADTLEAEPFEADEGAIESAAPPGLRHLDPPAWLAASGAKGVEKALRERLDDKLAITVFRDPVTKSASRPGETREDFAARLGGGGEAADKLRQKVEKKRNDLAVREQEVSGRKREKWLAIGSAVLSNIGLLTGRKRSVSGVGSVLSKNRMEGTAEARLEALRAELSDLERQLAETAVVDAGRLVEESLEPVRGGVELIRYDVVWVH
jgi:hypothetical protein